MTYDEIIGDRRSKHRISDREWSDRINDIIQVSTAPLKAHIIELDKMNERLEAYCKQLLEVVDELKAELHGDEDEHGDEHVAH